MNILIGQNGSGKSLINKLIFFASIYTVTELQFKSMGKIDEFSRIHLDQQFFDGTFDYPEEFTGHLEVHFENGSLKCDIDQGILSKLITTYDKDVTSGVYPKYLSTTTRLFTSIEAILALSKHVSEEIILKRYRLYDIMHCNGLKHFAINVCHLPEDMVKTLKEHYDFDIVSLTYNEEECKFYYSNSEGVKKAVSTLGNGHQSILNMFVANLY